MHVRFSSMFIQLVMAMVEWRSTSRTQREVYLCQDTLQRKLLAGTDIFDKINIGISSCIIQQWHQRSKSHIPSPSQGHRVPSPSCCLMVTCRPAMGMTDAVALPMVTYCTNQDRGIGLSIYHGLVRSTSSVWSFAAHRAERHATTPTNYQFNSPCYHRYVFLRQLYKIVTGIYPAESCIDLTNADGCRQKQRSSLANAARVNPFTTKKRSDILDSFCSFCFTLLWVCSRYCAKSSGKKKSFAF